MLTTLWNVWKQTWIDTWNALKALFSTAWALTVLIIGWIWFAIHTIGGLVVDLVNSLSNLALPNFDPSLPSGLTVALAIVNTFLPLDQLLGFFIAYLTMCLVLQLYSFIKTLIPGQNAGGG